MALVDTDEIAAFLRDGLQAADGPNRQSRRWLLIIDPKIRAQAADLYRPFYLDEGRCQCRRSLGQQSDLGKVMSSTDWLVRHLDEVPVLIVPCYRPHSIQTDGDTAFQRAPLYVSIYSAARSFQLALHLRGYGSCVTTGHLFRENQVGQLPGLLQLP
jgi:nitroreductase